MPGGLLRMLREAILVMLFIATILFIALYKQQVETVKMAGVPGEPNVQINVPLLLNNLCRYSKIA